LTKTHTTLTVDQEIIDKAKRLGLNMSKEFQNFLSKYINTYHQNIDGIDLEILNIEIDRLKLEADDINLQLRGKLELKEQIEAKMKNKEEERLKVEKENLEKLNKCIACGHIFNDDMKKYGFRQGNVCKACFVVATNDDVEKWNSGGVLR